MFAPVNLADKTTSTVHHRLNFVYRFLRDISGKRELEQSQRDSTRDITRDCCGLRG